MAGDVYSVRAIGGHVVSGSPLSYVVPAGHVFVIVDAEVYCTSAVSTAWALFVVIGGVNTIILETNTLAAQAKLQWTGRIVLNAGETVEVLTNNGGLDTFVSGYLLTTP